MRRTNIYLHKAHWRQLAVIGKAEGLKPSQLIRISIGQFLSRERRKQAPQTVFSGRARRQAVTTGE